MKQKTAEAFEANQKAPSVEHREAISLFVPPVPPEALSQVEMAEFLHPIKLKRSSSIGITTREKFLSFMDGKCEVKDGCLVINDTCFVPMSNVKFYLLKS